MWSLDPGFKIEDGFIHLPSPEAARKQPGPMAQPVTSAWLLIAPATVGVGSLLWFSLLTPELFKDKLMHIKNFTSVFEQKLIAIRLRQARKWLGVLMTRSFLYFLSCFIVALDICLYFFHSLLTGSSLECKLHYSKNCVFVHGFILSN